MIDGEMTEQPTADVAAVADSGGGMDAPQSDYSAGEQQPAAAEQPSYEQEDGPPAFWKKEAAQHWQRLDPEVRSYIRERELNQQRIISKWVEEAQRAKPYQGIAAALRPFDNYLQQLSPIVGQSPEQLVHGLLGFEYKLRTGTPEEKVQAISQIISDYQIENPFHVLPPQMQQQMAKIEREWLSAQQRERDATAEKFFSDKQHWQEIAQDVMSEMKRINEAAPGLPPLERLKLAYDNAMERTGMSQRVSAQREREAAEKQAQRERDAAERQRAEYAKRVDDARRSAKVNVRSASNMPPTPKTMDETIEEIARLHYGT